MGSDFQRTLLWVVLAATCFMLWDNWQVYNGKPSFFQTTAVEQTAQQQNAKNEPAQVNEPAGSGAAAVATGMIQADHPVKLENDLLKLNIDEQGAVVTRAELIKERQEADWTEVGLAGMILGKTPKELKNIVLFNVTPKHVYVAQSGLIGGNFPNHKTRFKYLGTTQSKKQDAELGREVTVHTAAFEATEGMVTVRKSYELADGHVSRQLF